MTSDGLFYSSARRASLFGFAVLSCCIFPGCSNDLPYAPVSGKVTLNDKPLTEGTIVFARKLEDGRFADPKSMQLNKDGEFHLQAHVGENVVKVDIPGVVSLDPEGMAKKTGRNFPALMRYASFQLSGLTCEIPAEGKVDYIVALKE